MSKRIQMTPEIEMRLRKAIDNPEADLSNLAVFEARMISTEPLRKGGFWQKARISESTLKQMEDIINADDGSIPLHVMHNSEVLPVGRVFAARTQNMNAQGDVELRGLFYIPEDEEDEKGSKYVDKIENSTIKEVSVGVQFDHAYCSECGFDFFGEDSSIMNILSGTCENGHEIGKDGVHARLVGTNADNFHELSLVGRGGARDAKILSRAKQSMGQNKLEQLAASGLSAEATVLTASYPIEKEEVKSTLTKETGESDMDIKELMAELKAGSADLAKVELKLELAEGKLSAANSEIEALKASVTEKDEKIQELEAGMDESVKEDKAKADKALAELQEATEKLVPHVKAALVASGADEKELPEGFAAMLAMVEEKGLKLHQVIGTEAKSVNAKDDVDTADSEALRKARLAAFKSSK